MILRSNGGSYPEVQTVYVYDRLNGRALVKFRPQEWDCGVATVDCVSVDQLEALENDRNTFVFDVPGVLMKVAREVVNNHERA